MTEPMSPGDELVPGRLYRFDGDRAYETDHVIRASGVSTEDAMLKIRAVMASFDTRRLVLTSDQAQTLQRDGMVELADGRRIFGGLIPPITADDHWAEVDPPVEPTTPAIAFLRARIAEDRSEIGYRPCDCQGPHGLTCDARQAAELEAKSRVLDLIDRARDDLIGFDSAIVVDRIVQALLAVYRGHPDYRAEWDLQD